MKKLLISCLLVLSHISYAHKADNPYYPFIKKHTLAFAQSLSAQERDECLAFLVADAHPQESWLPSLNYCFETMYYKFLTALNQCACEKTITITEDSHHLDEFGVYLVLGLYRVVYKHAGQNTEETDSSLMHPWKTPNEIDIEYLSQIHE